MRLIPSQLLLSSIKVELRRLSALLHSVVQSNHHHCGVVRVHSLARRFLDQAVRNKLRVLLGQASLLQKMFVREFNTLTRAEPVKKAITCQHNEIICFCVQSRDSDLRLIQHEVPHLRRIVIYFTLFALKIAESSTDGQTAHHSTKDNIAALGLYPFLLVLTRGFIVN